MTRRRYVDDHRPSGEDDGYDPIPVTTHFRFPDDEGDFAKAALRCVGVGLCRRTEGGTMCPSYMVTREEEHSTRGRARLLFEVLQGDVVGDGWQDERVKDALDLCLSCKGCKASQPPIADLDQPRVASQPVNPINAGYSDGHQRLLQLEYPHAQHARVDPHATLSEPPPEGRLTENTFRLTSRRYWDSSNAT